VLRHVCWPPRRQKVKFSFRFLHPQVKSPLLFPQSTEVPQASTLSQRIGGANPGNSASPRQGHSGARPEGRLTLAVSTWPEAKLGWNSADPPEMEAKGVSAPPTPGSRSHRAPRALEFPPWDWWHSKGHVPTASHVLSGLTSILLLDGLGFAVTTNQQIWGRGVVDLFCHFGILFYSVWGSLFVFAAGAGKILEKTPCGFFSANPYWDLCSFQKPACYSTGSRWGL